MKDPMRPRSLMVMMPSTAVSRMARRRSSPSRTAACGDFLTAGGFVFGFIPATPELSVIGRSKPMPIVESKMTRDDLGGAGDGCTRSVCQQLRAIFGRRLAEDFFEYAVEMRERLEADFKGDFTHAQIRVEQKIFGFFNPHARDVIGEIDADNFFERLAEVITAHVRGLGDLAEGKFLGLMFVDVGARLGDDRRLRVFALDENLVAQHGQMLRKNTQEFDGRIMF